MDRMRSRNVLARGWRNVREAGRRRLALTAVLVMLAALVARFAWGIPVTDDAERALYDYRSYVTAQRVAQDDRVLLVVYDDQTLIAARKRSPLDRGLLAAALRNLDGMGARAIGIDILFDQPQDEDEELVATLRAMRTPTRVAFVDMDTNADDIAYDQQVYLDGFLARLQGSRARPASIVLDNSFGVTRNWPTAAPDQPPLLSRALVAAGEGSAPGQGYEGAMRYRLPAFEGEPVFASLAIGLFADAELAPMLREQVEGRYVLIGADLVDVDRVETPLTANSGVLIPGLAAHAEMIAQMLDRRLAPPIAPAALWAFALLVVLSAGLTALVEWRDWRIYPLVALQFALFAGVPFWFAARGIDTLGLPAFGWLVGWVVTFAAVTAAARASGAVQRNFAQGALGKYLPREMAQEIIENPSLLALHGEKKEIFVLFSDLEGFTKMSHAIQPEQVAMLLNRYLESLSQVVLDHGGVIDKFVGDAVVAFWGAPIARPDDGERAARAGLAVWQAGERFRAEVAAMEADLPPVGKTRVGLHFGEAVVGNFGGATRIQYTALGDSMNTAARLEAANKALDSSVMASREFAERSGLDWWRPMGRVVLRGRARPVDLMEPAPQMLPQDRAELAAVLGSPRPGRDAMVSAIATIAARYPDDKALENLLHRMRSLGDGEDAYVLG